MDSPIKAISIKLGYDESEDRLVFFVTDPRQDTLPLSLTRRTTGRLIDVLAQILERTSILASRSAAETRAEILLMEHQKAIAADKAAPSSQDGSRAGAPNGASPAVRPVRHLVERIDITTKPAEFALTFFTSAGAVAALTIGRVTLHHFVELLRRTVDLANWNLKFGASWLNAEHTKVSIN